MKEVPGFSVRRAKRCLVVEIDYFADPAKDAAWAAEKKRPMPSEAHWRREYERDWTAASGDAMFPEFMNNQARYLRRCPGLVPGLPVLRGWDFGPRNPACVFAQYSPRSGRVWALRELYRERSLTNIHTFRDVVRYCSGQIPIEELHQRDGAMEWLDLILGSRTIPDPPWFAPGTVFRDFSGHEAAITYKSWAPGTKERCDAEVLASAGIYIGMNYTLIHARETLVRRMMLTRPDKLPGLFVDSACPYLATGLAGGLVYRRATKQAPEPNEPMKNKYVHTYDALGYLLAGVVPAIEERAPEPQLMIREGRELVPTYAGAGFESYETVRGLWD
jgi:hypothetical protein